MGPDYDNTDKKKCRLNRNVDHTINADHADQIEQIHINII